MEKNVWLQVKKKIKNMIVRNVETRENDKNLKHKFHLSDKRFRCKNRIAIKSKTHTGCKDTNAAGHTNVTGGTLCESMRQLKELKSITL